MMMAAMGDSTSRSSSSMAHHQSLPKPLPLVISLNCIDDCSPEQESLSGIAAVEHVSLSRLSDGRIESSSAVLLHSLVFLPRAAQRRLRPWQLILCLGSSERTAESALATDLGLRLVHVDASRAEEIADSVMALFLGLLRRTHMLMKQSLSSSGWLGYVQPLCRGMRRCRGLVLGIIGISASARSLATRSLAFKMSVLYFDVQEGKEKLGRSSLAFPPAARRMDTLNDLLAASDLISLHCILTNETVQIINAECLEHLKPGSFLVNTGSSQLLDDCAVKQLLIDGTLAGCALDGAEGPQWMEAWVREMPNVLILPRSADYSDEVWMDIREKAVSIMHTFFIDGVIPKDAISDTDDDETEANYKNEHFDNMTSKESASVAEQPCDKSYQKSEIIDHSKISTTAQLKSSSQNTVARSEGKRSRSGKKAKRRQARQRSKQNSDDHLFLDKESCSNHDDDDNTGTSSTDQVVNSSEDCHVQKTRTKSMEDSVSGKMMKPNLTMNWTSVLKEGCVIALHARDRSGFHVSRQRGKDGGWYLDTLSNVTKRDPAAQFLVVLKQKDTVGLRSFVAGGKLLQVNRRMELVFASHSFDIWESWIMEGSSDECRLVNRRNPMVFLDARIEVLAVVGDDDGVTRWLE